MSSSSSSPPSSLSANTSSLAGCLHGGNNRNNNYYDLTTDNIDGDDHATSTSVTVVAVRGSNRSSSSVAGRRRISATMDDGRTQQHRSQHQAMATGSSTDLSRSGAESRHRSVVSIIDLVDDSDDDVEFVGKKRSLPLPPPEQTSHNRIRWQDDVADEYGHAFSSHDFIPDAIMNKKRIRIASSSSSSSSSLTLEGDYHHHHHIQQPKPTTTTTTTPTHSYYLNLPSRKCPRDGATITFGLPSLINVLLKEDDTTTHNTRTCEGSVESSRFKLKKRPPISSSSSSSSSQDQNLLLLPYYYYNHQPFHYLQHDNWSCGYRNLQMLLSSMMPTLQSQSTSSPSSFYTNTTTNATTTAATATVSSSFSHGVPCIEEIQRTMELLWSQGYDIRNAEHHKYALVGKKTWIGAVEVWYVSLQKSIVSFVSSNVLGMETQQQHH